MLMVAVGCTYPWNPLAALGGAYVQWFYLMFGGVTGALVAYTALAFPSGVLTRPALIAALLVCLERLILAPAVGRLPGGVGRSVRRARPTLPDRRPPRPRRLLLLRSRRPSGSQRGSASPSS